MTPGRFREIIDALHEGDVEDIDTDELVDAGELAYLHELDQVSFLIGYELGRRRFVPNSVQARRLRIRART